MVPPGLSQKRSLPEFNFALSYEVDFSGSCYVFLYIEKLESKHGQNFREHRKNLIAC